MMTRKDTTSRKDQLKSLLLGISEEAPPPAPEVKSAPRAPVAEERAVSGSVKAMKLSLGALGAAAEEAEALKAQLTRGEAVIEVDPASVAPSFIIDRLAGGAGEADSAAEDPGFDAFLDDLRRHGQQAPVLLRPDPAGPGRYQLAYGHRRWRAALQLGRPLKAIVRALSDADLVIAQGQENARRRDLSFIEKAVFAAALDARGFDRATLVAALAVQSAEVTRLLAVARAVPAEIAARIGPAPKAGRPRWMALAEGLADKKARARVVAALAGAATRDSDARFQLAFEALAAPEATPPRRSPEVVLAAGAAPLVRLAHAGGQAVMTIDERAAPALAAAITAALPEIYARWQAARDGSAA